VINWFGWKVFAKCFDLTWICWVGFTSRTMGPAARASGQDVVRVLLIFNLFVDVFLLAILWGMDVFDSVVVPWDSRLELTACFCALQLMFLCVKVWITRPFGHSTVQGNIAKNLRGTPLHPVLMVMSMPVQGPAKLPGWRDRMRNTLLDAPLMQNWVRDFLWQMLTLWGISQDVQSETAALQMTWQFLLFLGTDAFVLGGAVLASRLWLGNSGAAEAHQVVSPVCINRNKMLRRVANIIMAPAVGYLLWDFAGFAEPWTGPKGVSILMGIFEATGQLWWHWDLLATCSGFSMFFLTSLLTFTPGAVWRLVALLLTDYSRVDFRLAASIALATAVALQNALVAVTAFTLHEAIAGENSALLLEPPSLCTSAPRQHTPEDHSSTHSDKGGRHQPGGALRESDTEGDTSRLALLADSPSQVSMGSIQSIQSSAV